MKGEIDPSPSETPINTGDFKEKMKGEGYLRNPIMNSSSFACGSSMGDSKAPFRACGTNKLKLRTL